MKNVPRVKITDEAKKVIDQVRTKHGESMFHQSGGGCDGSSPVCYEKVDFLIGAADI